MGDNKDPLEKLKNDIVLSFKYHFSNKEEFKEQLEEEKQKRLSKESITVEEKLLIMKAYKELLNDSIKKWERIYLENQEPEVGMDIYPKDMEFSINYNLSLKEKINYRGENYDFLAYDKNNTHWFFYTMHKRFEYGGKIYCYLTLNAIDHIMVKPSKDFYMYISNEDESKDNLEKVTDESLIKELKKHIIKFKDLPNDLIHQIVYYSFRGINFEKFTKKKIKENCNRLMKKSTSKENEKEITDIMNRLLKMHISDIEKIYNEYSWDDKFIFNGNNYRDEWDDPYDFWISDIIFTKSCDEINRYELSIIDGFDISEYYFDVLSWKLYKNKYYALLHVSAVDNLAIRPQLKIYVELVMTENPNNQKLIRIRDSNLIQTLDDLPSSTIGEEMKSGIFFYNNQMSDYLDVDED